MGLYSLTYLCCAVFVIAFATRIYRQFTLPVHLRWELYPVKHESSEKANYGGSYMEELNWWEKKRRRYFWNEIKYMIPEILFLRGVWNENRRLWWVSFPFHFALYMLIGTLVLLFFGAIFMVFGGTVSTGSSVILSLIYYLTILCGFLALTLGALGTAGLLYRRFFDPELKNYSSLADYFNLFIFLIFFIFGLFAWLFTDLDFAGARAYLYGLLTLGGQPEGHTGSQGFLGQISIVIASFLIGYIPLTHMSHMFMKYFIYHSVRWEDSPNLKGSKIETAILENLGFKPTWASAHIGADGKKSWAEITTSGSKEAK